MNLISLFIYPIKSCRGIEKQQAQVTPKGFAWDREFMWVDSQGKFISQREYPELTQIQVQITEDVISLAMANSTIAPLSWQLDLQGNQIPVNVWRSHTIAIDQGDEVAQWLHQALALKPEQNFRLVRQSPQHIRAINPQYTKSDNEPVSFADGYPYLLTNTASLADLNQRISIQYQDHSQTIEMNRFRPNIVVDTTKPFIEDSWKLIQIGSIIFDVAKPCDRCIVTTTNQITGTRNSLREPLKTLSSFRHFGKQGILFGQNLIPRNTGYLNQGDRLQVLETR